jgi:hypothetical protein
MEAQDAGPLRRLLLWLVVLGILGLTAELFLLEHTEELSQWLPFLALGAALAACLAVALRPTPGTVRAMRAAMALGVAIGVLGLGMHLWGNLEFERENDPSLRGLALVWESLRGATPALAPGALAQLGLLGLVYTFRHPALRRPRPAGSGAHSTPKESA